MQQGDLLRDLGLFLRMRRKLHRHSQQLPSGRERAMDWGVDEEARKQRSNGYFILPVSCDGNEKMELVITLRTVIATKFTTCLRAGHGDKEIIINATVSTFQENITIWKSILIQIRETVRSRSI